jgi:hypothetical protein
MNETKAAGATFGGRMMKQAALQMALKSRNA